MVGCHWQANTSLSCQVHERRSCDLNVQFLASRGRNALSMLSLLVPRRVDSELVQAVHNSFVLSSCPGPRVGSSPNEVGAMRHEPFLGTDRVRSPKLHNEWESKWCKCANPRSSPSRYLCGNFQVYCWKQEEEWGIPALRDRISFVVLGFQTWRAMVNKCAVVEESDTSSLLRTMQALKLRPSFTDRIEESLITHRLFIQDDIILDRLPVCLSVAFETRGEERESVCNERWRVESKGEVEGGGWPLPNTMGT